MEIDGTSRACPTKGGAAWTWSTCGPLASRLRLRREDERRLREAQRRLNTGTSHGLDCGLKSSAWSTQASVLTMPCCAARSETSAPAKGSSSTAPVLAWYPRRNAPQLSSVLMLSSRSPSVSVMLIGVVMSRPKKSASENWTLRLAPGMGRSRPVPWTCRCRPGRSGS